MFLKLKKIKKKFSDSRGFSYVELIVMVMVIGIISVIVIANYNTSEKNQSVVYAAQQIEHDIRNMQAMSLTGKKEEGDPRPCGYGIKFAKDDTFYTLFRELPDIVTKSCADDVASNRNKNFDAGEKLDNGEVYLPRGVSVSDVKIDNGAGFVGVLSSDIFYTVPFADFFVVGAGVKITISNTAGVTKTINVIKSGEVSVD